MGGEEGCAFLVDALRLLNRAKEIRSTHCGGLIDELKNSLFGYKWRAFTDIVVISEQAGPSFSCDDACKVGNRLIEVLGTVDCDSGASSIQINPIEMDFFAPPPRRPGYGLRVLLVGEGNAVPAAVTAWASTVEYFRNRVGAFSK